MDNKFCVSGRHSIIDANFNSYEVPTQHPNRNMDMHDFIYILNGTWIIGQGNEHYTVQKDDVLILSAGLDHYGVEECSPGTKTMYIHASFESGEESDVPASKSSQRRIDEIIISNYVNALNHPNIKSCFEKIILAKIEGEEVKASAYFDILLYELSELSLKNKKDSLASNIRELIVSSVGQMLKNYEIADRLNVSVKTAENVFKNAYGMTIHQYLLKTKVEQAQTYLVNFPEMKLCEVARNLGFYDEYHLSRQFKNICHITPGEYRKGVTI